MNELSQHIIYGATVTLTIVAAYFIGYKQGRATAKQVALDTLQKLWLETELLQRKVKVEETANKDE